MVRVNGKEINDTIFKYSVYTIDLKSFHFKEEDPIKIEIVYRSNKRVPSVMNPSAIIENLIKWKENKGILTSTSI